MHGCRAEDMQNGAALHSSESIENAKDEDTIRAANDAIIVAIGIVAVLVANVAYVGALLSAQMWCVCHMYMHY